MDGLLIDSEILWHQAEVEIFGGLGVPISESQDRVTKGMYVAEVVNYWYTRYPWDGPSAEEVVATLLARVGDLVESVGRMLPGARRALEVMSERGPVALASSTPLALIYRCLDHFELRAFFQAINSAEFEPFGKPHPGVFLSASGALGVAPQSCLVLEDSTAGVLAAKAGSMMVIAVPSVHDRALVTFKIADVVLDSLEELPIEWIDAQFR